MESLSRESDVIFSGTGVVTAAGDGIGACMDRMMKGESFMRASREWDSTGCNTDYYGEVQLSNAELRSRIARKLRSERFIPLERGELLFLNALEEALAAAELDLDAVDRSRVALLGGTSLSGFTNLEKAWRRHLLEGAPPDLAAFLAYPLNVLLDRAAYEFGLSGPRLLFSTACSASLHPVIWASHLLDRGEADIVILAGADPLSMISMVGFSCLRSVAKVSSTPFSMGDPGVSIGEGAGVIIMERLANFRRRSQREVSSFLAGAWGNSDAYHPTASDPMGVSIRQCLEESLKDVESGPATLSLLVAHGTGTLHNDKVESRAIQQVGNLHGSLKTTSLKSMIGHTLGASGCVELALLIEAMASKVALPTANFGEGRPGCGLDVVRNTGIDFPADIGIKSAFAFGGNNVTVSLTRRQTPKPRKPVAYSDDPVVITGVGMLGAYGDVSDWELVRDLALGKSALRDIPAVSGFHSAKTSSRAALFEDADLAEACEKHRIKDHRKLDRISRLATIAAQKCLKHSGLAVRQGNAYSVGLISGTSTGHLASVARFYSDFTAKGPAYADAGLFPNTVVNAHAGYITIQLRIKGYTTVLTQGNVSGAAAVDLAVRTLRAGVSKMVLAGATSEYSLMYHRALIDTGLVDDVFLPYRQSSLGNCLGDGSVFLALERREDAELRGARILGEVTHSELGFVPCLPSTFRFESNPLTPMLSRFAQARPVSCLLGDGNGFAAAGRWESDAFAAAVPGARIRSFTSQLGYSTGVNTVTGLAVACLARDLARQAPASAERGEIEAVEGLAAAIGDAPVATCISEGGGAALIGLGLA